MSNEEEAKRCEANVAISEWLADVLHAHLVTSMRVYIIPEAPTRIACEIDQYVQTPDGLVENRVRHVVPQLIETSTRDAILGALNQITPDARRQ